MKITFISDTHNKRKDLTVMNLLPGGDIIIHTAPKYILDTLLIGANVGCEELAKSVEVVKPKIHCFGHIHSGYGEKYIDGVQYLNASVLGKNYLFKKNPINIEYNIESKEVVFI